MTETMGDYTRTHGPEAFRAAAAEPGDGAWGSHEQKMAWLQTRLDSLDERFNDGVTALLFSQLGLPPRIRRILTIFPFLVDNRGSAMGGGNNVLPLVLAFSLFDGGGGGRQRDIGSLIPLLLLLNNGGSAMGGGNNVLPLVLAFSLFDGDGGGRQRDIDDEEDGARQAAAEQADAEQADAKQAAAKQ